MDDRFARESADTLTERLLRVENALFFLKAKSKYISLRDNTEVERLEGLRADLRSSLERITDRDHVAAG
jgi:hypothetical protein